MRAMPRRPSPRTVPRPQLTAPTHANIAMALPSGVPNTAGMRADVSRFMERYHINDSARYHRLLLDDPNDLHDHPWNITSLLLTGGYREHTTTNVAEHWAPTVIVRRAEEPHRLELLDGPMWTLALVGPVRRRWGFHTQGGWVHWSRYDEGDAYSFADVRGG